MAVGGECDPPPPSPPTLRAFFVPPKTESFGRVPARGSGWLREAEPKSAHQQAVAVIMHTDEHTGGH